MQKQRFEFKYLVHEPAARSIREFVQGHLELDGFGARMPDLSYPVHSLYLDSPGLALCQSTINGDRDRYKLRLRFYHDGPEAPVFLEIKRRTDNCIFKKRCGILPGAVDDVLAGQLPGDEDRVPGSESQPGVLEDFCRIVSRIGARPVAHVAYRREAWISPSDRSVRVTLDRDVLCEPEPSGCLDTRMADPVRVFGSHVVVELKFTGTYPGWFAQLVRTHGLIRCGAAKYVDGATLMGLEPGGRRSGGRANGPATLSPRAHLDRRERLVAAYH